VGPLVFPFVFTIHILNHSAMSVDAKRNMFQDNIGFLFIGIWICTMIGFHRTYTIFFPQFTGFQWEQHFHGAVLMSWFAMLIVQPFLIRFGKNSLHRTIGKLGYVIAPLVCFSIFLVLRMGYYRDLPKFPEHEVLRDMALPVPNIIVFGTFFILAMVNRRDSFVHMRYMIGTSLIMIGPGLGRALEIYGGFTMPQSKLVAYGLGEIIATLMLWNDFGKGSNVKPMLTVLSVLLLDHFIWISRESAAWQAFAKWFAAHAF